MIVKLSTLFTLVSAAIALAACSSSIKVDTPSTDQLATCIEKHNADPESVKVAAEFRREAVGSPKARVAVRSSDSSCVIAYVYGETAITRIEMKGEGFETYEVFGDVKDYENSTVVRFQSDGKLLQ